MGTPAPDARSVRRFEDSRFLTGAGTFAADLDRAGALHAAFVRSPHAHAEIRGADTAAARAVPGVAGLHFQDDLAADGIGPLPCVTRFAATQPLVVPPRHALARGRVRHVGEPVALVLAETPEAARDAAELVNVDYAPLPAVVDPRAALAKGAPALWAEAPGNVAFRFEKGDRRAVEAAFAAAAHVVELEIVNQRIMAAPVEPRAGVAAFDPATGTMSLICSAQGVHALRRQLAEAVFRCPEERIRIAAPDVGGGFGMKNFLYPEWVLLPWAARRRGRRVAWVAERGEDHAAAVHGRDITADARLALDAGGRFLALSADLVANMGACLSAAGPNAATTALPTAMGGVYGIPAIHLRSTGVFTNAAPIDAYRGAGKPEANFIVERLAEAAARRLGIDPVEIRRRNAFDAFPRETAMGTRIDGGRFRRNIEDAARLADREGFAARRAASERAGRLRGLGFGCFLETARGTPTEGAEVRFAPDGRVELRVGTESNGQGHETAYRQIAAARLGLPPEAFDYIQADTARTRMGNGHGGARTMHMGGGTMALALEEALAKARSVAATLLQADPAALEFAGGRFAVAGEGRSVGLPEVAAAARDPDLAPALEGRGLDTFARREDAPFTFPNGCHVAEVEVDPETGAVTLARYAMADDYGALVNPMLAEGQVHGGVAQGIGQALGEIAAYDAESGQFLSGSPMDYRLPRAADLPAFETRLAEDAPTAANPLGVKGTGQAGCIAAPQTVVNAVLDALAPLGVTDIRMPLDPQTVWRAIRRAREGR